MISPAALRRIAHALPPALLGLLLASGLWTLWAARGYFFDAGFRRHQVESAAILFGVLAALRYLALEGRALRPPPGDGGPPRASKTHTVVRVALFGLLALVVYHPALNLGLLSDDFVLVAGGQWNVDPGIADAFFRPISRGALAALFHLDTGGLALHAAILALHALNALLVRRLALLLGLEEPLAVAAGLLFLVFPASVEAVAWASGIQDVLVTTLALLFLGLTATTGSPKKTALALVVLVLGLGTKETAVAYPILALVVAWATPSRRNFRHLAIVLPAALFVSAAFAAWRLWGGTLPQGYGVVPDRYALKELLTRPFAVLAVPWTAGEEALHPALGWLASLGLIGGTSACLWLDTTPRLRARWLPAGVAWVLASVAPVYGYFFVASTLQGSRYAYLPAAGWCVLLAGLAGCSLRPRVTRILALTVVIALIGIGSSGVRGHLEDWKTAAQLRDRVLANAGDVLRTSACASIRFVSLPDSFGGAYVFRNGFEEAMALHWPGEVRRLQTREPACVFAWDSREYRFLRSGDGAKPPAAR